MVKRTEYLDPYTQEDTRNLATDSRFEFVENNVKYVFDKNMILKNFRMQGRFLSNPYTRKVLNNRTLNRLQNLVSKNKNALTNNEMEFNQGVKELMQLYNERQKNLPMNKRRHMNYRKAANEYIDNLRNLQNENNLLRLKNSVIRKMRY